MCGLGAIFLVDEKLSAHAQVGNKYVGSVKCEPHKLAATVGAGDLGALQ